ncbi:MAG TPA: translation initiation factor IF-2 [Candidatus Nanoarchaeia archaeon]|nr:translation initiation factor IF-2 [Candidatus Nanoarchaeia archaeon]
MIRSLICTFVGHVDHGKTTIQDYIRGTSIAKKEPGLITQHISGTKVDFSIIKEICGDLLKGKDIKLPGFLFLDTPGHASFNNLRKRGSNLADIAVLVIDINESIKPQTLEALEILKQFKTPFVIAANKIDLIQGYRSSKDFLIKNLDSQSDSFNEELDTKIYTIVGKLSELGIISERFDRIDDYTKQAAIIPLSAKSGNGVPELLMVLAGLGQKFLEKELQINPESPGKGTILEVKEEKGIGTILETVLYDGNIKENDIIIIGSLTDPIVTRVKAIFSKQLSKTMKVERTQAVDLVNISCPDLKEVYAGMPLRVANNNIEKISKEVREEVSAVLIETTKDGIIVKADSLGSLEALISLLKENEIKIKHASIGNINKKDIQEALSSNDESDRIILAFNVKQIDKNKDVKVINHDVIYKIIEEYDKYIYQKRKDIAKKELEKAKMPAKIYLMPGYIFRQNNPAVVGVEVLAGKIKVDMSLMKDGKQITQVQSIQENGKAINEAERGKEVAVAFKNVTVGRQINSGDILYSYITENDFRRLKKLKQFLKDDESQALKEIAEIYRKQNPVWGV